MKEFISPVIVVCLLAIGCAVQQASRIAVWEKNQQQYSIQAKAETGAIATDIVLYVNGQEVAKGSTNQVKPQVNLSGMYKDIKIDAECKSVATGRMLHRECTVYANSEKVADLSF